MSTSQTADERIERDGTGMESAGGALRGDEAVGEPPTADDLPLDQVFDLLRNQRRRLVLEYLAECDDAASTSDLAEHVAAFETGKPVGQLTSDERKRAYVGLYQCHLPKMDSMDVIEFNKPRGVVHLDINAPVVTPYLDFSGEDPVDEELMWSQRYLALSVIGVGALVPASLVGAPLVATLAFAAVVAAFGVCSLIHCKSEGMFDS